MKEPKSDDDGDSKPNSTISSPSPFVTTSRILNLLNQSLEETARLDADPSGGAAPHFELQRKLPNGSTRKATQEEQKALDFENTLQQVFQQTQNMTSLEKHQYLDSQRQRANTLYQQEKYTEALDIYLTCLPAIDLSNDMDDNTCSSEQLLAFLTVMNNLAQCCLQIQVYQKAIRFTELAMEQYQKQREEVLGNSREQISFQFAKLHYKRGKAHRLRGEYSEAKQYLEEAASQCSRLADLDLEFLDKSVINSSQQAIQKELSKLSLAVSVARRTQEKQKRAMQKLLYHPSLSDNRSELTQTLYQDEQKPPKHRQFSTLRVNRRKETADSTKASDHEGNLSVGRHCCRSLAKLAGLAAQKLLDIIGEDEADHERGKVD